MQHTWLDDGFYLEIVCCSMPLLILQISSSTAYLSDGNLDAPLRCTNVILLQEEGVQQRRNIRPQKIWRELHLPMLADRP